MTRPADHDPAIDDMPIARAVSDLPDIDPPAGWEERLDAAFARRRANRIGLLYGAGILVLCALGYLWFRN